MAAFAVVAFGCVLALYLVKKVYCYFKVEKMKAKEELPHKKIEDNPHVVIQEQVEQPVIHFDDKLKDTLNLLKKEDKQEGEKELENKVESKLENEKAKDQEEQPVALEALPDHALNEAIYANEPALLAFGKARVGSGEGTVPNLMGMKSGKITVIDFDKILTAGFACCFHTTESHEDILKLIREIRIKNDPRAEQFGPRDNYAESYHRLYNNLVRLHEALPGERHAKEVKIYWNERIEKTLLPHFFMNENINVNHLVFAVVAGEEVTSPFQAPNMDFTNQLQFVGIDEKNLDDIDNAPAEKRWVGKLLVKADIK